MAFFQWLGDFLWGGPLLAAFLAKLSGEMENGFDFCTVKA